MHRYKLIEIKAGATLEIIKCIPGGCRKGAERSAVKKTKEEIQRANMRQAARKLARKINANFMPGDWHVTLTYKRGEVPTPEESKKNVHKLLEKLRKWFRKVGKAMKYVLVTEYKKKTIHHHLVINQINDGTDTTSDQIRKLWKKGRPKFVPLYEEGEYQGLADYLIKETDETFREKETPFHQRYSCSRNLVEPKVRKRMVRAREWEMDPRPRKGYYILPDSLYNGFDKMGYRYQRYVMVKINPTPDDWKEGRKRERGGGRSGKKGKRAGMPG